ncbi:(Fe-S)-binding protein [Cryptosporangium aurantiacum]|uniref:Glycolate oxidase iron-sulfur subunit n=1 Tax=Cryptosporangium aurantiacum TaxID=134849 RepID=A0A1M7RJE2_9ACTN|nr:heterodisulfide reductase-related iron-sulfur binding cluster [Cryptosporangium aurantiacum]SHN46261.1 glycolate oxidase iron-sulfur subunit [Cryptosporangium aurantiacum]
MSVLPSGGDQPALRGAPGAWDPQRPPDPDLIKDCVHCGFCLTTCPSYTVFGNEADSPRGRIVLMRVGHEESETLSPTMQTHFDRCLGCMACVTACPSGVQYDRLIEQVRPQLERNVPRSRGDRAYRALIYGVFTHPGRVRALVPMLAASRGVGARLARLVPRTRIGALLSLAPPVRIDAAVRQLPRVTPAAPDVAFRGRIGFLQGCIQRALFGDVNASTVRVLAAEGFEVHAPRVPRCCGALQLHGGAEDSALVQARKVIAAYAGFDTIAVNVAGCGSAMKDYGHLLADDPEWAARAAEFSAKVRDVHEVLAAVEPQAVRHPIPLRIAYHDACHLAHAQGVRQAPRDLLRTIPGLELVEPAEWELCCGSAGIYNLTQPAAAAELGRRKAANLAATGADAIAAANPGCALQVTAHLESPIPIHHPMTLLDDAIHAATLA